MKVIDTKLQGVKVIEPDKFDDNRGYYLKSFEKKAFREQGIDFDIVQVSHSSNQAKGTIRGMHFQLEPFAQDKIIFCVKGKVFDIAIDLRKNSATYGEWYGLELSEENKQILYIPKGFAHGFETLVDNTEVIYFISEVYSKEHESGIKWNEVAFGIDWPLEPTVISEKDQKWPAYES
ncbi:MAG: dTDP-4-dehydrorhamnose 3,5-epimerase [Candidatus Levyibacteriota bacterium]|jgi:dTDP-4-dehydrorhamnose 3,5-epimerase